MLAVLPSCTASYVLRAVARVGDRRPPSPPVVSERDRRSVTSASMMTAGMLAA